MPLEFRRIQAARLVDWDGTPAHADFVRLLEAIEAIVGEPSPAGRPPAAGPLATPGTPKAAADPPARAESVEHPDALHESGARGALDGT